ncbi:MAG TPA: S8 family serine peptidase [Vicinamibacterales bacterium]|nr:S8 family serine peptidase [Vicinamibacterales bacterium]
MTPPKTAGFLVRLPAGTNIGVRAGRTGVRALGARFELEPLFDVRTGSVAAESGAGIRGAAADYTWHVARPVGGPDAANAWDVAHALNTAGGVGLKGEPVLIEPDFIQSWPYGKTDSGLGAGAACNFEDQRGQLPHEETFAWHLEDDKAQLRKARNEAGHGSTIRIAHLDTGYDENHATLPRLLKTDLQRNFVNDQPDNDARDRNVPGGNPGHGTGTLSILAGNQFAFSDANYQFNEWLGGAPEAEVIPVRVGKSVIQLLTSNIAKGINYAVQLCADEQTRVHVISMSMGGVASSAWADAINMAYEAGIVFVAAAGNNFSAGAFPFPARSIVYPARFKRVIAACGVMADRRPYYGLPFKTMQGNWGPASKMATAMSAFTPNISWAKIGCRNIVDMDGQGTSSATPQVAAAAALYLQKHGVDLFDAAKYPERWMCVEAVRRALFSRADKNADGGSAEKLGNGILQASAALALGPPLAANLRKTAADSAWFPLLRVLTGVGIAPSQDEMLLLEATQLLHRWSNDEAPNPLEDAVIDPDLPAEAVPGEEVRRFLEAVIDHPEASKQLKARAETAREAFAPGTPRPRRAPAPRERGKTPHLKPDEVEKALPPAVPNPQPFVPGRPAFRTLRGYSIDPALTTRLDTAPISQVTFKVPWETLKPGPVGEYLEVIDVDPASGCFYEPVDLDHPSILAQDGLPPSEGTPQFHQQMVYAVASLTIKNFERALGRRSLWSPRRNPPGLHPKNDSYYVQRLRIYPHGLREQNAYYSPVKVGLLFGYFRADENEPSDHVPGGMIFSCLSHDIVAHETTHALLDGMHRNFLKATNPDVRAFHEAFADIVALMQHFTFPEILRHQIASTQGDLRNHESLLGELAGQFGRASGMRGALRYAIGEMGEDGKWRPHKVDPSEIDRTFECHDRGAILVAAVFEAFLGIYGTRTADLLRLATGGSGILQPGAIHPDLVGRLAAEAAKAAQHVLTMCIRALDYCPPVDITFGEFLRAIITADTDCVPDDDMHYRIAFVEAFRRRGIYPRDLRTLSPDSLLWRTPESDEIRPSRVLQDALQRLHPYASDFLFSHIGDTTEPRERVFHLQRELRRDFHEWLKEHFATHAEGLNDARFLGLDPHHAFEVHTARFALRPTPDGDIDTQVLIGITQESSIPSDPSVPGSPLMPFEGGCTLVGDLRKLRIRYCIRKNVRSPMRQARQQVFAAQSMSELRSTYFDGESTETFAALHRGMER